MRTIQYGDTSAQAELGDILLLNGQEQEVVKCIKTGVNMVNVDADEIRLGDLRFIKKLGLTISNPDTDKPVALGVDYIEGSFGERVKEYFEREPSDDDDDDDSDFFSDIAGAFSGGSFGGGSSFGGFSGGGFSGGGASGGF